MTVVELAPHGDESVNFLVNDELLYHAGDPIVPARPGLGHGYAPGPIGTRTETDDANDDDAENQDDNHMEVREDKTSGLDLGALEKDYLEYQFSDDDDSGEVDKPLLLMTPFSLMSSTKEAPASLSPVDPVCLALESQRWYAQKQIHESPRRRRIDETMRVCFLGTLSQKEWVRYQSELERKTGVTWTRRWG